MKLDVKKNPNKINLEYLSNRNYSKINFNPSNQFIKAKKLGLPIPQVSEETKQKISNILKNSIKVKVNSEFSNSHKFHVNFCEECFRMFESNSNRRFCSRSCSRKNYIRVNGISEEFLSHKPSMLGKHHSEETKEKLRLAAIKQWKRQKGIT